MITYSTERRITTDQYITLCARSGMQRPQDPERAGRMLRHANLHVTAWDGERLVGYARGLTDFAFDCYLCDLAVDPDYQKKGIGTALIQTVRDLLGEEVLILLLAAKAAMEYYPKVGFTEAKGGYWIPNTK
ncbi:GNAT family N-acetyltransferase [Tumebacillus flagellatus]|uniref:N-acetyltransferase domain-containing protein n=1 Tax=Tumebacillus flagellatus TaxID=1157490 RepID=A0A074LQ44_9BACL|nr:GNAT family N-acetyltransferase [Tumebacillus flagellatus]KEO84261.1 hypothetical protein EL26_05710 [Tumebacillus flagellatus]